MFQVLRGKKQAAAVGIEEQAKIEHVHGAELQQVRMKIAKAKKRA